MGHYLNEMASPKAVDEWKQRINALDDAPLGWRCPVCGRGLAPHVSECSCRLEAFPEDVIPYPGSEDEL